jgi:hypothetical protein
MLELFGAQHFSTPILYEHPFTIEIIIKIVIIIGAKEMISSAKQPIPAKPPVTPPPNAPSRVSSHVFPVFPDLSSEVNIAITPIIAPIITHPNKILPNIIDCFKILVKVTVF